MNPKEILAGLILLPWAMLIVAGLIVAVVCVADYLCDEWEEALWISASLSFLWATAWALTVVIDALD
jgi:hypothetical protein